MPQESHSSPHAVEFKPSSTEELKVRQAAQQQGVVRSLEAVVETLRKQGARMDLGDLRPEMIGLNGFVGTTVQFKDDRVERVWIRDRDVINAAASASKARVAEFLTLGLAGVEKVPVRELIREYLRENLGFGPPICRAALLSHMGTFMGFVFDPLAKHLWLPPAHPMSHAGLVEPTLILPPGFEHGLEK